MRAIRSIISAATLRSAGDKTNRAEFTELVLNCAKSEPTHIPQFENITLLLWRRKKQAEHLGTHLRKQHVQYRALGFHVLVLRVTALSSQEPGSRFSSFFMGCHCDVDCFKQSRLGCRAVNRCPDLS